MNELTNSKKMTETQPVLPVRDFALLPYVLTPLVVDRPSSLAAVEAALQTEEKSLVVVAQKNSGVENPGEAELYSIGTKAVIKRMARDPGRSPRGGQQPAADAGRN